MVGGRVTNLSPNAGKSGKSAGPTFNSGKSGKSAGPTLNWTGFVEIEGRSQIA
jgi:hypothetical protein